MKRLISVLLLALAAGYLAGCAGTGGGTSGGEGSGVTVFGTIDAGVSGYKNQSSR